MKKEKNSLNDNIYEIRDLFISKISENQKFETIFGENIQNIVQKIDKWGSSEIRIGLFGVTSSGKTTLINALIGKKLLPQRARPSSTDIVVCKKSDKDRAVVFFEESAQKQSVVIDKNIEENLKYFADDEFNHNNEKMVKEIHIESPNYKLNPNVILIDTPGLDSYAGKHHEKITLQLALPLVDIILFLTTVKANSDKENLKRIEQLTDDEKPIIIVQNMKDTVDYLIGKGGKVRKNKTQVLDDHYNRIKNLLSKSNKSFIKNAQIIQISAIKSLKGEIEESNIKNLLYLLNKTGETYNDHIVFSRLKQLKHFADKLYSEIKNKNSTDTTNLETKLAEYEENKKTVNVILVELDKNESFLNKRIAELYDTTNIKIKNLPNKNSYKEEELYSKFQFIKTDTQAIVDNFSKFITEIQKQRQVLSKKFDVTNQDIRSSIKVKNTASIKFPKHEITKHANVSKKKKGLISKFLRKLDFLELGWGYEETKKTKKENIIYKKDVRPIVIGTISQQEKELKEKFYEFRNQENTQLNEINKKIDFEIDRIRKTENTDLTDIEKNDLLDWSVFLQHKIDLILNKQDNNVQKIDLNKDIISEKNVNTEVCNLTKSLLNLSNKINEIKYIKLRNYCIKDIEKPQNLLVWCRDENDLNNFFNIYFPEIIHANKLICKNSVYFLSNLKSCSNKTFIKSDEKNVSLKLNTIVEPYNKSFSCAFFLIDPNQIGFFKKIIFDLVSNNRITYINFAIQDINVLTNSNNMIESVIELLEFAIQINKKVAVKNIIVSSKDYFYSVLFNYIYQNYTQLIENKDSIVFEKEILDILGKLSSIDKNRSEKIIRELKKSF